jgi:hypothetical protein
VIDLLTSLREIPEVAGRTLAGFERERSSDPSDGLGSQPT